MPFVDVWLLSQQAGVIFERFAGALEVVDQPPFAAPQYLREPDRRCIINAKVERGPHAQRGVMADVADAPVSLRIRHELPVIAAAVRRVERALKLLGELLAGHL